MYEPSVERCASNPFGCGCRYGSTFGPVFGPPVCYTPIATTGNHTSVCRECPRSLTQTPTGFGTIQLHQHADAPYRTCGSHTFAPNTEHRIQAIRSTNGGGSGDSGGRGGDTSGTRSPRVDEGDCREHKQVHIVSDCVSLGGRRRSRAFLAWRMAHENNLVRVNTSAVWCASLATCGSRGSPVRVAILNCSYI